MANLASVLKNEIVRLAKKEARSETSLLRKQSAQYRRDIAALKRQASHLQRQVASLERQERKRTQTQAAAAPPKGFRFTAKGLKSHREKLGISAADYAALVGCSALSVYNWEADKSRPREEQLAKLAEVRALGVRDAWNRLEQLD